MRLLVDTHCWLWMQTAPERFSSRALELLMDTDSEVLLSAASSWEIAIKFALGKLPLPAPPQDYVPSRMLTSGTTGPPKRVDLTYATMERVLDDAKHYERDKRADRRLRSGIVVVNYPITFDPGQ